MINRRDPLLRWGLVAAMLAVALAVWVHSGYFGRYFLSELAVYAIFAMSLDLLAGYTGLVSLGQALFFGLGAYATALLTTRLGLGAAAAMALLVPLAILVSAMIGALAVRVGGIFFIMITLAVGEMFYALALGNRAFGGSDGITGVARIDLAALGIDMSDPGAYALFAIAVALLVFGLLDLVVRSPYGAMLRAIHQNERRLRALGAQVYLLKVSVFVLASTLTAIAGSLMAQLTGFVSPDLAHWTVSGQVLIMAIVGGLGTLAGPALGAVLVQVATHYLSKEFGYWMLVLGSGFIMVVLFADNGLYGLLRRLLPRPAATKGPDLAQE